MRSLIVVLSFLSLNVNAQKLNDWLMGRTYHDGFVVMANGDTLKRKLIFTDDNIGYSYVNYVDSLTQEIRRYKPNEIQYFSFDSLFFYSKNTGKKNKLMLLLIDDGLKLYVHKYLIATAYYTSTGTAYWFEKPDGQMLEVLNNKIAAFSKKTAAYFSDYPELSEKIKNKTYKIDDVFIIAEEYNNWLKSKQ